MIVFRRWLRTDLVATTVIKMVVGRELAYELNALFLGSFLHLRNIVGIDGKCLVGLVVNEQVCVVVLADWDWDDLHS